MRSLHMKLVMIMVLLILSLMMVVGAFLINSVTAFYLEDFYSQMSDVFSDPGLVSDLTTETPDEENGAERMADVLDAYVGVLGVDGRNRKLYILDSDGVCLVAPEGENQVLEYTKNLNFALNTGLETNEVGDESNLAADYMDLAVPIHRGDEGYVIYILDIKATANSLTVKLFLLIMEALVFGLVISLLRLDAFSSGGLLAVLNWKALLLAAALLALTRIGKLKNLHPAAFLALSAVVGVVFRFGGA